MGKFRSKLKGASKGKRWAKGQSSSSNPETRKHRDLARSRFFQENLGPSNLTSDALRKHDAVQALAPPSEVQEAAMDDTESSVGTSTYNTYNSFASEWTQCSNMSFNRFLKVFRSDSALHKEMLAILAAIAEVIKENGGSETPTEYYCSLLTTLEQIMSAEEKNEDQITAVLSLLNMGIKTVPEGVLQTNFDNVSKKIPEILEEYSTVENNVIVKSAIGVLAAHLRALDVAVWTLPSTQQIFGMILNPFCVHSKPKWRKAAQQAAAAIVRASRFSKENSANPPADKVAEFCKEVLDSCIGMTGTINVKANQTTILHVLGLMKENVCFFSKPHMKKCCETILSLMMLNYPLVTSCSLQVLYALFSHQSAVVPAKLNAQVITALYEYQPASSDTQSTLAWLTVMQQAHIHLADVDLPIAAASLPKAFSTFMQLWLSDKVQVTSAVTHALERLLRDALAPVCETPDLVQQYKSKLQNCFSAVESGLTYQYNIVWQQVLYVIGVMFEVGGKNCSDCFLNCLKSLAELRDSYKFSYNNELERTVGAGVRYLGPEVVLGVISLQKANQELCMERSWLLPVLKENVKGATLEFWINKILPMALFCQKRSAELQNSKDGIGAHSYELLCLQLWNLLPSFCNKPTDINANFKNMAKTLGTAITSYKELRLAVMASLRKLIMHAKESGSAEDVAEVARFDKNYLPILFNIYTAKSVGTDEEGQRLAALDTIKVYLTIAKPELTKQLFLHALERLESYTDDNPETAFAKESILDLIRALVPYQTKDGIESLYKKFIKTLSETKNSREQKKAYRLLEEICGNDADGCKEFLKGNRKNVQKLLIRALNSAAVNTKGARLRCLNYLIKAQPQLNHESVLIKSAVPEAILCCKDINEKCRAAAFALLNTVGDTLAAHNELQQYVVMVVAGLTGSPQVISATVLALASVIHNFSGALGNENIQFILESVTNLATLPAREIVSSCLSFIKMYCSSLPSPMVGASIPVIMKALTGMTEDCKRHFRLKVRDILDRLVRKYGSDSILPHIPASDTVMYKRLRNLRKINARKKRKSVSGGEEGSESEDEFIIKAKPKSIEEILADSDSENETDADEKPKQKKKQKSSWIKEDGDSIVDFTDPKVANKITATKPAPPQLPTAKETKKNKGFKTAPDGRLVIKDGSDSESDSPKGKKKLMLNDSDSDASDDAETLPLTNNKRKRPSSVKSGFSSVSSQPPSKYRPGGSGIHRPVPSVSSRLGAVYKSKKAAGDIKKKGKADPYAYVPLKRSLLNKRKKAKMGSQFKHLHKAAKAGALKGAKAKKMRLKKK